MLSLFRSVALVQWVFPKPDDWTDPDRNQYGTKSVIGAAGTYNHLTDAVLDVSTTRAMYMRRLRNLADKYYGGGRLRQVGTGCLVLLVLFCIIFTTTLQALGESVYCCL